MLHSNTTTELVWSDAMAPFHCPKILQMMLLTGEANMENGISQPRYNGKNMKDIYGHLAIIFNL